MRYSIRTKIILGLVLIVTAMAFINVVTDLQVRQKLESRMNDLDRYHNAMIVVTQITNRLNEEKIIIQRYKADGNRETLAAAINRMEEIQKDCSALEEKLDHDPELLKILKEEIRPSLDEWRNFIFTLHNSQSDTSIQVSRMTERIDRAQAKILIGINNRIREWTSTFAHFSRQSNQINDLIDAIAALGAIAIGWILARSITQQLEVLKHGIKKVEGGEYQEITNFQDKDEIGKVILAFNQMTATIRSHRADLEYKNMELQVKSEQLEAQNEELQAQGEELLAQNEEILSQQEELQATMVKLTMSEEVLNRLYRFGQSLTQTIQLRSLLDILLNGFTQEAGAQLGALFLYNEENKKLELKNSKGIANIQEVQTWYLGEGLLGQAAQDRRIVITSYNETQLRTKALCGELNIATEMYLPLIFQEALLGMVVVGRVDGDKYSIEEKKVLSTLADQAAIALHNSLTYQATHSALIKTQEIDRLKSELLSTVSHELRTPLASILGFAELLLKKPPTAERTKKYLETIYNEATRLTGLVNNFLDLQRIETGRFGFSKAPLDVASLVAKTVEVFQAQSNAHKFVMNVQEDLPAVVADADRLTQVLGNLLSNAVKYSPSGGQVDIRVGRAVSGNLEIQVQDYGLGIPAEAQKSIFEPFFRVDNSDRRKIGGTGLGLAISRKIMRAHGGDITVKSVHGQGSTFTIVIPVTNFATSVDNIKQSPAKS